MSLLVLPIVEASGTPRQLGEAIGASLRPEIAAMIDRRMHAASAYFVEHPVGSVEMMVDEGAACLNVLEAWDAAGFSEHHATAAAAGVDAATLYAAANYSDVRDIVCEGIAPSGDEGCTSVAIAATRTSERSLLVGQTWDLHPLDVDSIIAVHRLPSDAPETWSVTVAGAPTLIGMNNLGLWTGTTNIKVDGARTGVCYMNLLHRAIRCSTREEADEVIQSAPRAAAHTFLLADPGGAIELECTATTCSRRDLADRPLIRTNHCFNTTHAARETESPSPSSVARSSRAEQLLDGGTLDVDAIRDLMIDREGGLEAINRYPEDGESTATNACMIGIPAARRFEACRGPADRGEWTQLPFQEPG